MPRYDLNFQAKVISLSKQGNQVTHSPDWEMFCKGLRFRHSPDWVERKVETVHRMDNTFIYKLSNKLDMSRQDRDKCIIY